MPTTVEAVALLVFVFLPGYMAASVFWWNTPRAPSSDAAFGLQIARWSAFIHVLALPVTAPAARLLLTDPTAHIDDPLVVRAALALLLGAPALGFVLARLSREARTQRVVSWLGFSPSSRAPTAWDWVFRPGAPGSFLAVHIKDVVDPIFGEFGEESIVGITPSPHDIFMQARQELVHGKLLPVEGSAGVWIAADQIEFIEVFRQ